MKKKSFGKRKVVKTFTAKEIQKKFGELHKVPHPDSGPRKNKRGNVMSGSWIQSIPVFTRGKSNKVILAGYNYVKHSTVVN